MKPILKAIYIILAIFMVASCTPKTEENATQKNETEKPAQVAKADETQEYSGEEPEKEKSYTSDEEHYYKKGSLLFYNLNINDSFETVTEKVKKFGVKGLSEIKAMPKELEKLGCKAYVPYSETYEKDPRNDFYIIFKDNKIIRFIKYQAGSDNLLNFCKKYPNISEEERTMRVEMSQFLRVSGEGYSYDMEVLGGVIYREEVYYLRDIYTMIITRDGYKDYFEKLDRESDKMFEFGDLYFYGLHIKNDMETVKAKLDKNGIEYKQLWFDDHEKFLSYDGGEPLVYQGFAGIKSTDSKIEVWCYKDRIVFMELYPDVEQAYLLLQYFRRKYPSSYKLKEYCITLLNRCVIILGYTGGIDMNSIYFIIEDPSIVGIYSHGIWQELSNRNKN